MQALDHVRPPLDGDTPPLGDDERMMSLLLGEGGHLVGERHRLDKILELENALQSPDPVLHFERPRGELRLQLANLRLGQGRVAAAPTSFSACSRASSHPWLKR